MDKILGVHEIWQEGSINEADSRLGIKHRKHLSTFERKGVQQRKLKRNHWKKEEENQWGCHLQSPVFIWELLVIWGCVHFRSCYYLEGGSNGKALPHYCQWNLPDQLLNLVSECLILSVYLGALVFNNNREYFSPTSCYFNSC